MGKRKGDHQQGPLISACRCSPRIAYDPENFPFKEFPPPKPPNGQDDLWELQFCRWWGWNWVRKKEIEGMIHPVYGAKIEDSPVQKTFPKSGGGERKGPSEGSRRQKAKHHSPSPRGPHTQRINHCQCYQTRSYGYPKSPLPTKRELKDLCKCIIFQKPSRELPPPELQNLYNTPSHSVVLERERYSFNRFNQNQKFIPCEAKTGIRGERQKKKKSCAASWCSKPRHTSSSEDLICTDHFGQPEPQYYQNISTQCRPVSSTEESMEYLTVRMQHVKSDMRCPCQSHVPSKKQSIQTIPMTPPTVDVGCQCYSQPPPVPSESKLCTCRNEEKVIKCKGKKKKTLSICVCCCNCYRKEEHNENITKNELVKQDSVKRVSHNSGKTDSHNSGKRDPSDLSKESKTEEKPQVSLFSAKEELSDEKHQRTTSFGDLDELDGHKIKQEDDPDKPNTFISTFSMPITYDVQNAQITTNKQFAKFGNPSKNYPWLYTNFSNTATMSMLSDDSFTSPISGKTYNFAALQFNTNEKTRLPDLLDTSKDLEYLKSIQSSIKNETEQNILFDAMCDAFLKDSDSDDHFDIYNPFNFDDLQWPTLNKPSECDNGSKPKWSNILNFDNSKRSSLNNHLGIKACQTLFNEDIQPNLMDPANSFPKCNQKESFINQDVNDLIEKVLKVDSNISSFSELPSNFQSTGASLNYSGNSTKEMSINKPCEEIQKTDVKRDRENGFKDEVKERPNFTKTGLLTAEKAKPDLIKFKRSVVSSRGSSDFKKLKPYKKISFETKNRKVLETNYLPSIEISDTGNPFLEEELTTNNPSIHAVQNQLSHRGSLDDIFSKIDKTIDDQRINEKLSCLSEKSEPEETVDINLEKCTPEDIPHLKINTDEFKHKSYEAFSLSGISNRSDISSKKDIQRDKVTLNYCESNFVSENKKSYSDVSKISKPMPEAFSLSGVSNKSDKSSKKQIQREKVTLNYCESNFVSENKKSYSDNSKISKQKSPIFEDRPKPISPVFDWRSLVTLGVKSGKKRVLSGKKSMIPVRKKQKH